MSACESIMAGKICRDWHARRWFDCKITGASKREFLGLCQHQNFLAKVEMSLRMMFPGFSRTENDLMQLSRRPWVFSPLPANHTEGSMREWWGLTSQFCHRTGTWLSHSPVSCLGTPMAGQRQVAWSLLPSRWHPVSRASGRSLHGCLPWPYLLMQFQTVPLFRNILLLFSLLLWGAYIP